MKPQPLSPLAATLPFARPRLGFLGTGWIGRNRLEAIVRSGLAEVAAVSDADPATADEALKLAGSGERVEDLDRMIDAGVDGIVIATPSALHAEQAIRALEAGVPVFCQKPLGRDRREVEAVVQAARRADRLLGVDLSYRFTAGAQALAQQIREGDIGRVFAADLEFHNAYGPDKPWFYDRSLSGGGCVIDLGVHLVDMALWLLGVSDIEKVDSALYRQGQRLPPGSPEVEDFAVATLETASGVSLRLSCSWRLHAGCDAVIRARFFGEKGGLEFANVDGSFYDFVASRHEGTSSRTLCVPPDDWGGRAAVDWVRRLSENPGFDPACEQFITVADALDRIYDPGKH
jgi:predicted dehydrogenase